MSDLDNLMKKLKKTKTEEPEEEEVEEEETEEPEEEEVEEEETEDEEEGDLEEEEPQQEKPLKKKVPKQQTPSQEEIVGHEIGLLQNDGIYRREKLSLLKEQNDLFKIIAGTVLEIKKKLLGEDGGKKEKK